MGSGEERGFDEDGVYWDGPREELEAWKKYKHRKAIAFVERGYSVEWYPDGDNVIDVFVPERHHAKTPEVRAIVKFFGTPSRYGIDGGMVSKLTITERRTDLIRQVLGKPYEHVRVLYNFDRGPDIDRLAHSPVARDLYNTVIDELN